MSDEIRAPHVISDIMAPTRHMADGNVYDSKRKFREVTKAHGCIEIGDQKGFGQKPREPIKLDKRERVEAIQKAMYDLRNGRR